MISIKVVCHSCNTHEHVKYEQVTLNGEYIVVQSKGIETRLFLCWCEACWLERDTLSFWHATHEDIKTLNESTEI